MRYRHQVQANTKGLTYDCNEAFSTITNFKVLHHDPDSGWKMVTIDENKPRGLAPPFCQRILKVCSKDSEHTLTSK